METKRVKNFIRRQSKALNQFEYYVMECDKLSSLKTEDEFSFAHILPNTIAFVKEKKISEQKCSFFLFFFLVFSFLICLDFHWGSSASP